MILCKAVLLTIHTVLSQQASSCYSICVTSYGNSPIFLPKVKCCHLASIISLFLQQPTSTIEAFVIDARLSMAATTECLQHSTSEFLLTVTNKGISWALPWDRIGWWISQHIQSGIPNYLGLVKATTLSQKLQVFQFILVQNG